MNDMDDDDFPDVLAGDLSPHPPARLFDRLRQISGYTWDESRPVLHTSYDVW